MPKLAVEKLLLDPENPRLPEELYGAQQSALFDYLYENGVLDELAESMLDNGFFEHESIIVLPPDENGDHIVVEGNRRLASLMLIHRHPAVGGRTISQQPTPEQLERLKEVPAFEVADREEVRLFLGYRHISGLKPWKPEAKARYIASEVDRAYKEGAANPFLHVARIVGSNTQGIRSAYIALSMLRFARNECGVNTLHVLNERFGVWLRCMNSQDIKEYVGFGSPRTFMEVLEAVSKLNCERLGEVLADLSPRPGKDKPVLSDSRDVTQYGLVLQNDQAHFVLRKYNDLEIARQVVVTQGFPSQVESLRRRLDALRDDIERSLESTSPELQVAAEDLLRSARLLHGAVTALVEK
jgi:hypothetical protein